MTSTAARPRLSAYDRTPLPLDALRPASVLIPLRDGSNGLEVVFILRPSDMAIHGGQVAFPGGRVDPEDADRWATALRETNEELGVDPRAVERLGVIDDYRTITHYHVTPCVGLIPSTVSFTPAPKEVAEVFSIPVAVLKDASLLRTMVSGRTGRSERIYFYLTRPHVVWGATAAMLTNLLEVLGD